MLLLTPSPFCCQCRHHRLLLAFVLCTNTCGGGDTAVYLSLVVLCRMVLLMQDGKGLPLDPEEEAAKALRKSKASALPRKELTKNDSVSDGEGSGDGEGEASQEGEGEGEGSGEEGEGVGSGEEGEGEGSGEEGKGEGEGEEGEGSGDEGASGGEGEADGGGEGSGEEGDSGGSEPEEEEVCEVIFQDNQRLLPGPDLPWWHCS